MTGDRQLELEAVLDPAIRPRAPATAPSSVGRTPLLTGATGFLGTHLLAELLDDEEREVHCLVRARDAREAERRLRGALKWQRRWRPCFASRIRVIPGDLTRAWLGLSEPERRDLVGRVDAIFHAGAWINLAYPYRALKSTNVEGTVEVLRIACLGRPIPVHFVSSLAVFSSRAYADHRCIPEDLPVGSGLGLNRGYSQSKWVAERLVYAAALRGLPTFVYRPGVITAHSESGACNQRDRLSLLLQGCLQMKVAPLLTGALHLTPVDYVSRAVVALSSSAADAKRAFHLVAPVATAWSDVVDVLRDAMPELQVVPYDRWLRELRRLAGDRPRSVLLPLAAVMDERPPFARNRARRFDCANTRSGLAGHPHVVCPSDGRVLAERHLRFLREAITAVAGR